MIPLWQTLIERLLSWPVAVFVLALIFHKSIGEFARTITSLKGKGGGVEVEVSRTAEQQLEAASRSPQDPLALRSPQLSLPLADDVARRREAVTRFGGDDDLVLGHIETVKADLAALQFELNTPETTDVLIRHLAVTQLYQRAEFLYRVIFGSQIAAMEKMNISSRPLETAEVVPFFERARNRSPRFYAETTFEQWIGFLVTQGVVAHQNNTYAITLYGREFLGFITGQGLPRKAH